MTFGNESGTFPPFGRGRLLDVGCGIGDYLASMAALGWQCSGCNVSEAALKIASRKLPNARLYCKTLEELPFERDAFEAISLWHTLEHLPEPLLTLKRLYDMVVPGGRLVIAVPNIESFEAQILGKYWVEADIPGHLFFFSVRTLKSLVAKAGFKCLYVRPQVHPSSVSDSVDFFLDDLLGVKRSRQRMAVYHALFASTVMSYVLGNWGCIELVATKA